MKKSFLRFYIALLLSMIMMALGLEWVLSSIEESESPWLPAHHVFCRQFALSGCQHERAQFVRFASSAIELPQASKQKLADGKLLSVQSGPQQALVLAQHEGEIIAYGPLAQQSDNSALSLYLYLLFFSLFGAVLLFWLWPLFRDLDRVRSSLATIDPRKRVIRFNLPRRSVMQPLARVITQLSQQSDQLLQTQREMSHFIAHDLRTPLARMRFALALLDTGQSDLRQDLLDNIAELERTATEYLRYADNEAQHTIIELPQINADDFFASIKQQYRGSGKTIHFDYRSGARLYADAFSLQRAICNLLDNAERYAKVQITVRLQQRLKCCILQIDDDGPGIPVVARQSFRQLQAFDAQRVRGDREQGFGLGLYIVRRVAMLHRGHLKLLSSPQGGARFELVWPDAP